MVEMSQVQIWIWIRICKTGSKKIGSVFTVMFSSFQIIYYFIKPFLFSFKESEKLLTQHFLRHSPFKYVI